MKFTNRLSHIARFERTTQRGAGVGELDGTNVSVGDKLGGSDGETVVVG